MQISSKGIDLIKSFEGYSDTVYLCPAGYKTIGYGHLIKSEENFVQINHQQATELLYQDVKYAVNSVNRLTFVPLKQNQFDSLVSFTYNLGAASYQRSTIRAKVNRQEHHLVPNEFKKWVYSQGRIISGLVRRRYAEASYYLLG